MDRKPLDAAARCLIRLQVRPMLSLLAAWLCACLTLRRCQTPVPPCRSRCCACTSSGTGRRALAARLPWLPAWLLPSCSPRRCVTNKQTGWCAQEESGDWPQQHISGVFNRNCMITYANYRWV